MLSFDDLRVGLLLRRVIPNRILGFKTGDLFTVIDIDTRFRLSTFRCDKSTRLLMVVERHLFFYSRIQTPLEEVAEWVAKVEAAKEKVHGTP